MWIDFEAKKPYMIEIVVGGVSVISGEPAVETSATKLRRLNRFTKTRINGTLAAEELQDYAVVPEQPWLDGIATVDGTVRQFVAMPHGSAYSVEGQATGQEVTGELQFEVTPHDMSQDIVITVGHSLVFGEITL